MNCSDFNIIFEIDRNARKNEGLVKAYAFFRKNYRRIPDIFDKIKENVEKTEKLSEEQMVHKLRHIIESMNLTDVLAPEDSEELQGYWAERFINDFLTQMNNELKIVEMFFTRDENNENFFIEIDLKNFEKYSKIEEILLKSIQ